MADIQITLTIPDALRARVNSALNTTEIKDVKLLVDNLDRNGFSESSFQLDLTGLTPAQKVKTTLQKLLKAFVYQAELRAEKIRWETELNALVKPTVTLPDDIIN